MSSPHLNETGPAKQRIDKWLFFARILKSRTLAGKLADAGKVRINREKASSASHQVKINDVLTITLERRIMVLKILAFAERRGPYSEAKELYEDLTPPPVKKPDTPQDMSGLKRERGTGRPTKKDRRQIDKLRSRD